MTVLTLGPSPARRAVLSRRIRWFVAITITYNVIEAVVALAAGSKASSSALIGFGLDSVIEVSSAAAVAWQFAGRDPEAREKIALEIIACSFFGLAAFVTFHSIRSLIGGVETAHSPVGLVLAAVSLAVMPGLSYGQRRAGRELGSPSAVADSKQTLLCTYLSAVLLVGLGLNWLLGWSWADPIAALMIAGIAVKEGIQAWQGDACCNPATGLRPTTQRDAATDPSCGCEKGEPDCRLAGTSASTERKAPETDLNLPTDPRLGWEPAACTLPPLDRPLRLAEFDDLLSELRTQTVLDSCRLRWTLPGHTEARVRDLTARESRCCPFFTFGVTARSSATADREPGADQTSREVIVDVCVAPGHDDVLAALARRAQTLIS